ncbi:hypothetical protein TRFO_41419 [Tritrichomonas foetus]|uniref:Ion transport domain-containing protein n=1 Tax=Tritrichomonas foetus TaxID=1144522 RepID=A0A1J4L1M6_9EUKA|nr:hypothetical protein TRFO_41419 [Tritrichomonas foetus]|eukprot:OHT16968.1 hypothetical protein TRFO_41419 [Tritrichomonas foetus]
MEEYIHTFQPFIQSKVYLETKKYRHIVGKGDFSDDSDEYQLDEGGDDEEIDDEDSLTFMKYKEALEIYKESKDILNDKIDDPRILQAVEIINQKIVKKLHYELELGKFRKLCFRIAEWNLFNTIVIFVVIINVTLFILSTFDFTKDRYEYYFSGVDQICLGIYLFEMIIKITGYGNHFFSNFWNNLDLFIVIVSFIDYFDVYLSSFDVSLGYIKILRVFRILRLFRALKQLKGVNSVIVLFNAVVASAKECLLSLILLIILMYFYSVIGYELFRDYSDEYFGDFQTSFFTMFQLVTQDDWYTVYYEVRESSNLAVLFFITFIVIGALIVLSYVTAVLTDSACEAAVQYEANNETVRQTVKRIVHLKENRELLKEKDIMSNQKLHNFTQSNLINKEKIKDISKLLAVFGELEKLQLLINGHKAVLDCLIDNALQSEQTSADY